MPAGSVWEIYVPAQLGYGDREQGPIKPFSTLIFKIQLLSVNGK
jgi:FKBP-type peptidyl-prolyl cis-trans isomerase FklB